MTELVADTPPHLAELRQLLGRRCDLDPPEITDERGLHTARPLCVAYPETTAELSQILAVANRGRIPVVPLGGNTGLCAGAAAWPPSRCLMLSLSRLRQVRACDEVNFSITAEAGLTVAEVAAAAERAGMYFPLRFGADGAAQIGGAVSTNAGGSGVLRFGGARELVLGLEVVLADGRVLSQLEGLRKDNTGYDLKQLFIGSEGTLGVCSAVTLKLFAPLPHRQVALVEVGSLREAVALYKFVRDEAGEMLLAYEWMSAQAVGISAAPAPDTPAPASAPAASVPSAPAASVPSAPAPAPDAPAPAPSDLVLLELASNFAGEPALRLEHLLTHATQTGLAKDAKIAATQNDAQKMWQLREQIPQGEKRLGGSIKHDVATTVSALADFVDQASAAVRDIDPQAVLCLYGHLGDGNVHFNLLPSEPDPQRTAALSQADALSQAVYDTVSRHGGSFSAEHGIGLLHTDTLNRHKDPQAIQLMKQLKALLDPNNILNPGKVITP